MLDRIYYITKKYKAYIAMFTLFAIIYTGVKYDYFLYDEPIAEISKVESHLLYEKKTNGDRHEKYFEQNITATIKNGESKGKLVHLTGKFGESEVYTDKYKKGMTIFLQKDGKIKGIKRDLGVALAFLSLLFALIVFGKKQGLATCLCLIINIAILSLLLYFQAGGLPIFALSIGACIILCSTIIFLINGFSITSLLVLSATLTTIASITLLAAICMYIGKPLEYEFMDYLRQPYEQSFANMLFLSEILMGSTGVIIDIAMTIVSFAMEMLKKKPHIKPMALVRSCCLISESITGTMINVVFFTNIAAVIPLFIVSLKNDVALSTIFRYDIEFEAIRFFIGGIGILLAIPFSALIAALYSKRRKI